LVAILFHFEKEVSVISFTIVLNVTIEDQLLDRSYEIGGKHGFMHKAKKYQ
jgi:hypothetical protein